MQSKDRIKAIRTKSKLSQSKFSELFGIPVSTLRDWEQGKRTPPEYVVDMMVKILDSEHIIELAGDDEPLPRLAAYVDKLAQLSKERDK